MRFNPEDETLGGPRCRNCHRGSSGCGGCHNTNGVNPAEMLSSDPVDLEHAKDKAADNSRTDIMQFFMLAMGMDPVPSPYKAYTLYNLTQTSDGQANDMTLANMADPATLKSGIIKVSRDVTMGTANWRKSIDQVNVTCSDDGLSWPHRTLGWMMLKDDLFGIDVTGRTDGQQTVIGPNVARQFGGGTAVTHDLDSVCLDCHNPTTWNPGQVQSADGHIDQFVDTNGDRVDELNTDNRNDDLLIRGLP